MQKQFDIKLFPAVLKFRVRSYEIDFQNVVNNAVYFNYFEMGRIDYRKQMGVKMYPNGSFSDGLLFFVVKNSCEYYEPCSIDDEITLYTRIAFIKNSSFGFEQVLFNNSSGKFAAFGSDVIVNVDYKTRQRAVIPEGLIDEIKKFDSNVKITRG
ncbi:MAG: acyl-CoA thioesterase [Ignavibacteria bacterium]|nr:acyl-CoA thioesterase [Ignavibacteria bacterium]